MQRSSRWRSVLGGNVVGVDRVILDPLDVDPPKARAMLGEAGFLLPHIAPSAVPSRASETVMQRMQEMVYMNGAKGNSRFSRTWLEAPMSTIRKTPSGRSASAMPVKTRAGWA